MSKYTIKDVEGIIPQNLTDSARRGVEEYLNNGKNGWIEDNADQFVNVNMCKEIQLKREPEWHQNEVA